MVLSSNLVDQRCLTELFDFSCCEYDTQSHGMKSFKTQNERVYHRDRRSRSRGLSSFSSRGGRSLMSSYSRGPPISSFKQSKKFPNSHSSDSRDDNENLGVVNQPDRNKDAKHFEWRKNMILSSRDPSLGLNTGPA